MQPFPPDGPRSAQDLPNPRVLFCCLATPEHYPRPLFSEHEVFCGPDCPTVKTDAGFVSIATPPGEFDMAALVAQLPAHQKPELVVVKADATRRNFARNLDRIACPKVLVVGDTHHFANPIQGLLHYAGSEPFDFIVLDHTRHHGHFFVEAGFDRVYWIPAIDYALRHRTIPETAAHPLTFVGQVGAFHPYRRHVLAEVARAGLPLQALRGTPEQAADIYAASAITLNCSLNGDLNLRVFEALGSGAFLITDALSPDSGLERLFVPDRHLITYRTPGELVEKVRHYLTHPEEARVIRAAGQKHLLETQSPAIKRAQFYGLVYGDRPDPALEIVERRGAAVLPARGYGFRHRVEAYEAIQHLHLKASRLSVFVEPGDPLGIAAAVGDLPRVEVLEHTALAEHGAAPTVLPPPPGPADGVRDEAVLVLPWGGGADAIDRLLAGFAGPFVIAGGRSWRERTDTAGHLARWGFTPVEGARALHRCTDPLRFAEASVRVGPAETARRRVAALHDTVRDPGQAMAAARLAQMLGDGALLEALVHRCLTFDRHHDDALRVLATLAEASGRPGDAYILTAERHRIAGSLPKDGPDLESLAARAGDDARVARYRALIRPVPPPAEPKRRILVVTNLFPPQEFGGYGRKLWEFSAELLRRGHDVRILTADVPELARPGIAGTEDLEGRVDRSLRLYGYWKDGRAFLYEDTARCLEMVRANVARVMEAAERFGSEVCLVGNLDLLAHEFLHLLTARGIPVVHCLGNQQPGYGLEAAPRSPLYRPGPASRWVDGKLREAGFRFAQTTVLYPGARTDYFYRPVMPAQDRLRIAFASLYVQYKGPQVLLSALNILHRAGVDFDCTMAGEAPDADLLARSQDFCARNGLADKVRFTGFLDRRGMADLFARSNVLVFPSVFQEPFGISQVEAMAAGLTVVTSGTGGSQEIVRHGIDGLVFASENHEDLAAKLHSLVTDREGWARLALAGRERALEFAVGRSVDRIEQLFGELLAARSGGAAKRNKNS